MIHHLQFSLLIALIFSLATIPPGSIPATSALLSTTITIDGQGSGRIFDGVGALSGGGGTSRLLIDYPHQQQQEILDYLFKPNYGASLQMLKVEIGSDTDTTEGAEPSAQRTPTDQNYNRGYEWWLMQQAKMRNPNIKLYALEWGAPGWFSGGFWSQDNINYIINWLKHAQSDHKLHIDYIGGWNEKGYNITWYENLKSALKSNKLTTKIVGADACCRQQWKIANDMQKDQKLNAAVDIVGGHYPCAYNGNVTNPCQSDMTAQSLNKPLWQSEAGSGNYDKAAPALIQSITHGYIDDRITATINWTVVDAWYDTLPFAGDGLMQANQPWSGFYRLGKSLWAVAQVTQFIQPDWQFIDSASGYLGGDRSRGSYLSLKSTHSQDYSTIIETFHANTEQIANFQVTHGLSTDTVHVWATNLNSSKGSDWFMHQQDIKPTHGSFSMILLPNYIYSLTTTNGQKKGQATSPTAASLKLPYRDTFKSYSVGQIPHYFSTLNGAYETAPCGGGHSGMCLRQMITTAPISWMKGPNPLTVIGDPNWTHYQVSMDVLLEQSGYIDLIGGMNNQNHDHVNGYHLRFMSGGNWVLLKEDKSGKQARLAFGTTSFGLNTWHHLTLSVQPDAIQASIDSTSLATVHDSSYLTGQVGIQVGSWINAQFDNFAVTH